MNYRSTNEKTEYVKREPVQLSAEEQALCDRLIMEAVKQTGLPFEKNRFLAFLSEGALKEGKKVETVMEKINGVPTNEIRGYKIDLGGGRIVSASEIGKDNKVTLGTLAKGGAEAIIKGEPFIKQKGENYEEPLYMKKNFEPQMVDLDKKRKSRVDKKMEPVMGNEHDSGQLMDGLLAIGAELGKSILSIQIQSWRKGEDGKQEPDIRNVKGKLIGMGKDKDNVPCLLLERFTGKKEEVKLYEVPVPLIHSAERLQPGQMVGYNQLIFTNDQIHGIPKGIFDQHLPEFLCGHMIHFKDPVISVHDPKTGLMYKTAGSIGGRTNENGHIKLMVTVKQPILVIPKEFVGVQITPQIMEGLMADPLNGVLINMPIIDKETGKSSKTITRRLCIDANNNCLVHYAPMLQNAKRYPVVTITKDQIGTDLGGYSNLVKGTKGQYVNFTEVKQQPKVSLKSPDLKPGGVKMRM